MDALTLQAVIDESHDLNGSQIVAVDQYGATEIGLVLKGKFGRRVLFLSVHPRFARFNLTEVVIKSTTSSALLTVLRDHLVPGIMEEIVPVPFERVVDIRCIGRTPLGSRQYRLVAELIGNQGILAFMTDPDHVILETLRRIRSPARTLIRGAQYKSPPPMKKALLTEATPKLLAELGNQSTPEALIEYLTRLFAGVSKKLATEIVANAGLVDVKILSNTNVDTLIEKIWKSLQTLNLRIQSRKWVPCLGLTSEGHPHILSAVPIYSLPEEQIEYHQSISHIVNRFYEGQIAEEEIKQRMRVIQRALRDETQRLERLAGNLNLDFEHVEREKEYRRYGDLITSHLEQLKIGMKEAQVEDYYSRNYEIISIPLKPDLSPAENAQLYFRKARKTRDGRQAVESRITQTQKRLQEVQKVCGMLEKASDKVILDRVYRQCAKLGLVKAPTKAENSKLTPNRAKEKIHPRRYLTSRGHLLLVGRNSRENEILTKSARPDDIWLHARDMSGSHVILRRVDKTEMPSKKSLYEAACLAAYFSKGRGSTTVPVDYTERRYVRKMRNGALGQVVISREKTLFVEPKLELSEEVPFATLTDG